MSLVAVGGPDLCHEARQRHGDRTLRTKKRPGWGAKSFGINGRDGEIRTRDPLNPIRHLRLRTAATSSIS